jgi:hypothetical protein
VSATAPTATALTARYSLTPQQEKKARRVTAISKVTHGDPLPSWNDTAAKKSVMAYVDRVTREGSSDLVPTSERIAVFDNDGTLWPEVSVPFQAAFVVDDLKRQRVSDQNVASDPMVKAARGRCSEAARGHAPRRVDARAGANPRRNDDDRVRHARRGLVEDCASSALEQAIRPADLSAHAGAARLSARQRLQDVHRVGRRRRLHARVD